MISRRIDWVASLDEQNHKKIELLETKLSDFYSKNKDYYSDIDFTSGNWINPDEKGYREILKQANNSLDICEVGCGGANILKHNQRLEARYTGCDFSDELMKKNKSLYPAATFIRITKPNVLPLADQAFDFVFLVFVIEHSTNPARLLDECQRILKPGGHLMILCPDFLSSGRMTSQRAGFSEGTASQKLKKFKIIDAGLTLFDNRIRIPRYCRRLAKKASEKPRFYVNLSPVVFEDRFLPDVDAVYVTYKNEIVTYLSDKFAVNENDTDIRRYEIEKRIIFLSLIKS
jgi:SAM-dependent methyltransferase